MDLFGEIALMFLEELLLFAAATSHRVWSIDWLETGGVWPWTRWLDLDLSLNRLVGRVDKLRKLLPRVTGGELAIISF